MRHPLSADQERQWLVDRLLDVEAADDPTVVRLIGPLSMAAVHDAWAAVALRHDSMRTGFPVTDGVPSQSVAPSLPQRLPVALIDLSAGTSPDDADLGAMVDASARHSFHGSAAPLWRVLVVRTSTDEHILALTLHHLIADLWSVAIVIEEFCAAYADALAGRALRQAPPPAQPIEIARRTATRLTPRRRAALDGWWRERLRDVRPVDLPSRRRRPRLPNLSSRLHESVLVADLSDALRDAARRSGTTLLPVLLAGFSAVVARWSGALDVTVVSVSAGRRSRNTDRTVGLLTECLVLRLDLTGDPGFGELVRRSTEVLIDSLDHASLPFVDLVSLTDPARDREPSPLRQLGLSLHNVPGTLPGLPAVTPAPPPPTPRRTGTSEADIWLEVFDQGAGALGLRLQMDDVLFDSVACEDFERSFGLVLAAAVADSTVQLSRLPIAVPATGESGDADLVRDTPRARPDDATVDVVIEEVSDVLGLAELPGEEDNFFRLGGTSIDASRLAAALFTRLGVQVRLFDLMTAPTITGMAGAVGTASERVRSPSNTSR